MSSENGELGNLHPFCPPLTSAASPGTGCGEAQVCVGGVSGSPPHHPGVGGQECRLLNTKAEMLRWMEQLPGAGTAPAPTT